MSSHITVKTSRHLALDYDVKDSADHLINSAIRTADIVRPTVTDTVTHPYHQTIVPQDNCFNERKG